VTVVRLDKEMEKRKIDLYFPTSVGEGEGGENEITKILNVIVPYFSYGPGLETSL
jgi:hypothetical protein